MEEDSRLPDELEHFWRQPLRLQEHAAGEQRHVKEASVPLLELPLEKIQPCVDLMLVKDVLNLFFAFNFLSRPHHQTIILHRCSPHLTL